MGHSIRVTPAFRRYCEKYQPGTDKPIQLVSDQQREQAMRDFETCRLLSLELKAKIGDHDFNHFWGQVPAGCSTANDIALVTRMLELLASGLTFDQAEGPWKQYMRELIK